MSDPAFADPITLDPSILREYEICGIVGETLGPEQASAIGLAFGSVVAKGGGASICVGRDGRISSPELEEALVEGLMATGLRVHRIGLGPTPMLYFAVRHSAAAAGIMVTASHNPAHYNGFKMLRGRRPFFGKDLSLLARITAAGAYVWQQERGRSTSLPVQGAYVSRLLQDWDGGERALTVVWDPGHGAAGAVLAALMARLPGHHIVLNGAVDGSFPAHAPDPSDPANLAQLQKTVVRQGGDIGIAFDGDGDRMAVVDEAGRIVSGDQILALLAEPVLRQHPGATVITDVKASEAVFARIHDLGGVPVMYRTGHAPIRAHLSDIKATLAGETNGHFFFADRYYGYDDGLYAAVRLLGQIARWPEGETLSAHVDELPKRVNTPEIRFPCPDAAKATVIKRVAARLRQEGATMSDIDGVRVSRDEGWWLLRAANTQPVLAARCEAKTHAGLRRLRQDLADCLAGVGAPVPDALLDPGTGPVE